MPLGLKTYCKKVLNAVEYTAYKIKTNAESNGTIVLGNILKNLIPDFCIFYLPLCAESNRRVGIGGVNDAQCDGSAVVSYDYATFCRRKLYGWNLLLPKWGYRNDIQLSRWLDL